MDNVTERLLLETLTQDAESAGSHFWRRMTVVEELMAELLGGHVYDRRGAVRGPDILITRAGTTPIAVELKVLRMSSWGANIRNRVSDLLAQAVETRRSFRDEVTLGAVLLFAGVEDWTFGYRDLQSLMASIRRLLRQEDGVGYDSVLLGMAGKELRWQHFTVADPAHATEALFSQLASTSEVVEALHHLPSSQLTASAPGSEGRLRRILLVADEWRSGRGGISTVNRELATALAAAGMEAAVMVPRASEEDIRAASEVDVALVTPARIPGLSDRELLMLRPIFAEQEWEPDFVVGHGRVLGPFAAALQQQYFPKALRVHVVHTDAEELEAVKETLGGHSHMAKADERRGVERDLAQSAHLVLGVGPLLSATIEDEIMGPGQQPPVACLVPGLRDGFVVDARRTPVKNKVLFIGRADDFQSKGIDIAAEALLTIVDRWPAATPHPPALVIRGVPDEAASTVKRRLDDIFENRVTYHLRPYVDSDEEITRDLAQAKVVVMPSRHEGFGLAAYEAIASGVPVLVSSNSGLALFLRQSKIDTFPSSIVAVRNSATGLATDHWVDAIQRVLDDPVAARAGAAQLREQVGNVVTWRQSAEMLMREIGSL